MKRFGIVLCLIAAVGAGVSAQEARPQSSLQAELSAALQDMSTAQLGTLTVQDVLNLASRVSIAEQKIHYVQKVRMASMLFPGAGQFMAGDALGGSLFLTGDLLVWTGAVVGAYFLLPTDLQFSHLDYLNDNVATIDTRWAAHSVVDYLPSVGVLAGGMLLKSLLGHLSAVSAADEARANIASGKVTFTPNLDFIGRGGMMGMGMGMGMRMSY
jgi:hypothetical protein